jgi:hypothetical protein
VSRRPFFPGYVSAAGTTLAAFAMLQGCEPYDPSPMEPGDDALVLEVSASPVPADGRTVTVVEAQVPEDTKPADRAVTFQTTLGALGPGTETQVTVTAVDGSATAQLRAPSAPGVAYVRATRGTVVRLDSVIFARALADTVLVEPSKFALPAGVGSEMNVTAVLRRDTGTPTAGATVQFAAFDEAGAQVGQFGLPSLSDGEGRVQVRYTPGPTAYRGPVRIVASTPGTGGTIAGSAVVQVTDPPS